MATVAIAVLGAGCDRDDPGPGTASAPPAPLRASAERPIAVGGAPVAIAADESGVWVVDNAQGSVLRLEPDRPEEEPQRTRIPGGPAAVAIGEGAVWVASGDGTITEVEPSSGKAEPLELRVTQPGGIAAGEGSVWVTSSAAGALVRIDPESGETIGDPIDVGEFPTDVAVGDGSVWVANARDGSVSRIDVASGEADDPIEVSEEEVLALALGEEGVWVAGSGDRLAREVQVTRIDPATSAVEGEPASLEAGIPARIAAGEGGVWVTLIGGAQLSGADQPSGVAQIDPASGQPLGDPIGVGTRPSGIATGAGAVWVANAGDGTVTRIDPSG